MPKRHNTYFQLCFKLISIFIAFCALLELVLGYIQFQKTIGSGTPILAATASRWVSVIASPPNGFPVGITRGQLDEKLCSSSGHPLQIKFMDEYSETFSKLVNSVKKTGAHFILLYLPVHTVHSGQCRRYFQDLGLKFQVDFVDLSPQFSAYSAEQLYLIPEDLHLSRLGHQIIAKTLAARLQSLSAIRSGMPKDKEKEKGYLPANIDKISLDLPNRPYRLITNRQGFRMNQPLNDFSQRILVLGDSFTYGPHLSNNDIYSDILNTVLRDQLVINAGISGHTIQDELGLYESNVKHLAADIVVLQVSDNDLSDLFSFIRKNKSTDNNSLNTLNLEQQFIDELKSQQQDKGSTAIGK